MRYEIEQSDKSVELRIDGVNETQEPVLMQSFEECRSGRCGCPTDQYDKVASMDIARSEGVITIRLAPVEGQSFDTAALSNCLDHTITKAESGDS